MVWLPMARLEMVKVATSPVRATPPGVRSVAPSVKSTLPVGVPEPPPDVTVAVKVTVCPNADRFDEELTVVLLAGCKTQGSDPVVPSVAVKNRFPFTFVMNAGYELLGPGLRSATRNVPAEVPLLSQSSAPWVPSKAP